MSGKVVEREERIESVIVGGRDREREGKLKGMLETEEVEREGVYEVGREGE